MFHHSAPLYLYLYHNHLTRQVEHAHINQLWFMNLSCALTV